MNPNRIRSAAIEVADRIRRGEVVGIEDALMGDDPVGWLEDAAVGILRKDVARVKKTMREAVRRGASLQLELPGMGYAALPFVVFAVDADGADVAVPVWEATKAQIRREIELHRRAVAQQDKIVGGYEATLDRLDELGVPDDMTGLEMSERFPRLIEGGPDAQP